MGQIFRTKVDNIVLIGQQNIGHRLVKSQQLILEEFDEDL